MRWILPWLLFLGGLGGLAFFYVVRLRLGRRSWGRPSRHLWSSCWSRPPGPDARQARERPAM